MRRVLKEISGTESDKIRQTWRTLRNKVLYDCTVG